ncbi:hypothetical protein EBU99_13840 [bacterium]|nr:hypothetical protein [bacterium]
MRMQGMYWPTDFDQFQQVHVHSVHEAVELLRSAMRSLQALPNVRCSEIKWADRKMKPSHFLEVPTAELAALLQRGSMIKLDAIAWLDSSARYAEFSCVYEFMKGHHSLNPQKPHLDSLEADIRDFERKGQWFKALKRLAALKRAQHQSTAAFDAFFRSDYGLLYSVLSDLTTLDSLRHLPKHRIQTEHSALINRLGGLQLRDQLQTVLHDLLSGHSEKAEPILERIINEGAHQWLISRTLPLTQS